MIVTVTLNPSLDEWVHVPALHPGELHRAEVFARYAGGKGINVSRVVRELGARTLALAIAGGADGRIFRDLLQRLGLPFRLTAVAGTTRNNYKITTTRPASLTEINTPGPRVSSLTLRALEAQLVRLRPRPRAVVLSGSLPPGVPPSVYARWIRVLRTCGIPAALDASGAALRHGLRARPWLMKPNRAEAEELLGVRLASWTQGVKAVSALVRQGVEIAVLSLGNDGALLASSSLDGVWHAQPPRITVASAVGAGDSLIGGLLVGRLRQHSLLEAFRLGVACGTATALTPGTELCHRADVQRLLPRIRLRRVEASICG